MNLPQTATGRILPLLLLAQATLCLIFFRGYLGGDDYPYTVHAAELAGAIEATAGFDSRGFASYFAVRKGLLAPIAAIFALLGVRESAALLPMLLFALGTTAGMVALGRAWRGEAYGLWAGALMLTVPFNLRSGTLILADGPVVTWTIAGLAALVAAGSHRCLTRDRRRFALLAGAALAFSSAWLTKASVVCMAPVVAVLMVRHLRTSPRPRADATLFVGICTAVVAAEAIGYRSSRGDWLYRATAVAETNARFAHLWEGIVSPRRFLLDGPRAMFSHITFGLVPLASLFGAAWALLRRRHLGLVAWMLYLVLFFDFMSTSLRFYQPLRPVPIYFYFLIVPEALLLAAFAVEELPRLRQRFGRRWPAVGRSLHLAPFAAFGLALAFACTVEARNYSRNSAHLRLLVATRDAQPPGTAVYLDADRYLWGCRLLSGPADRNAYRRLDQDPRPRSGDLVAIFAPEERWKSERRILAIDTGFEFEPVVARPDWNLVIYRVKGTG